jgi:hypothetical protein
VDFMGIPVCDRETSNELQYTKSGENWLSLLVWKSAPLRRATGRTNAQRAP